MCWVYRHGTWEEVSSNEKPFMKHLLHELHNVPGNLTAMNGTSFLILNRMQWWKYSIFKSSLGILSWPSTRRFLIEGFLIIAKTYRRSLHSRKSYAIDPFHVTSLNERRPSWRHWREAKNSDCTWKWIENLSRQKWLIIVAYAVVITVKIERSIWNFIGFLKLLKIKERKL